MGGVRPRRGAPCGGRRGGPWARGRRAAGGGPAGGGGATPLGEQAAESWRHGRFRAPRLRDELLGAGLLIETLETATSWRELMALHARVGDVLREALDGSSPLVACHVSHLYA